jgi:hypothetical protein
MSDEIKLTDSNNNEYTHYLMSGDNIVAKLVISEGNIHGAKIVNEKLLPMGANSLESIKRWFRTRRIPADRKQLKDLENEFGGSMSELLEHSLALSLSDSFWIKPTSGRSLNWSEVNYYTNEFSDDIGAYLMGETSNIFNFSSPSNTTDGILPKRWIIRVGIRYLTKKSPDKSNAMYHLNEVMAYKIAKELELYAVPYFPYHGNSCICPCFVKEGQNLVSAHDYIKDRLGIYADSKSNAKFYETLSGAFGRKWLDGMLLLDFIIINKDRHLKNFGFLQDASTGKLIKPAPIFDCGNSLFASLYTLNESESPNSVHSEHFRACH